MNVILKQRDKKDNRPEEHYPVILLYIIYSIIEIIAIIIDKNIFEIKFNNYILPTVHITPFIFLFLGKCTGVLFIQTEL